jgi:predicted DCC family thiol-disulfide oxidoreductase YuxK
MTTRLTNRTAGTYSGRVAIKAGDWPAIPTVFFDGSCPLSWREIAHYRRSRYADRVAWIDLSCDRATLEVHGLRREKARERLHVLNAAGDWQTGAWAFAELWSHLPRYRVLASLLRHTGLLRPLDQVYNVIARRRPSGGDDSTADSPASVVTSGDASETCRAAKPKRNALHTSLSVEERSCA